MSAGDLHGSPTINSVIMVAGTILASFAGTTGAAMILDQAHDRANKAVSTRPTL